MTGRKRVAAAAMAGLVASGLLVVSAAASTTGRADSATIYAANTHMSSSGYVFSAGQGNDALFGPVAVTYKIKARSTTVGVFNLTVKRVVEYTANGSLKGTATATLTVTSSGAEMITNGKVTLRRGFGSLRGHSFTGTFSGSGSATANQFVLHVTGTYR